MPEIRRYKLKAPERRKQYRVRYEDELNAEQLDVVMAEDGPILVDRRGGQWQDPHAHLSRRLPHRERRPSRRNPLLTFTNKAAREMLDRVERSPRRRAALWGGTFHSVGNRLLRRHAEPRASSPSFSILDDEDQRRTCSMRAIASAGIRRRTSASRKARCSPTSSLLDQYGARRSTQCSRRSIRTSSSSAKRSPTFRRYGERKVRANSLDFDDLLLNWKRCSLESEPEVAEALKRRFRFILVDEYQDTNRSRPTSSTYPRRLQRNVMVVGDDAQSIYSFRGANFENILDFPSATRARDPQDRDELPLHARDPRRWPNASIATNMHQFKKELVATRPGGPVARLVGVDDTTQQALFIAQRDPRLRDEGIDSETSPSSTARTTSAGAADGAHPPRHSLQHQLRAALLRAGAREGRLASSASSSTRRTRSPSSASSSSSRRWASAPRRGLGGDLPHAPSARRFLGGAMSGRARDGAALEIPPFHAPIVDVRGDASRRRRRRSAARRRRVRRLRQAKFPNLLRAPRRPQALANFRPRLTRRRAASSRSCRFGTRRGRGRRRRGEDEKARLSIVHQAKGLEWKVVFVIGLNDGMFPSSRALRVPGEIVRVPGTEAKLPESEEETEALMRRPIEPDEPMAEIVIPGEEEERRLFYVAITRAKQELYLVYPVLERDRSHLDVLMMPSRFLRELPEELYEKWSIE